jgi:glycerol uptake facilitator-like aquaporin
VNLPSREIRPTDVPPFHAAQIVGARFAFFVSLAHVKDCLKQGDGVFESGLGNRYFGFVWACLTLTIVVKTSSSAAAVWKTADRLERLAGSEVRNLTRLYASYYLERM